jgi:hypothetical protein
MSDLAVLLDSKSQVMLLRHVLYETCLKTMLNQVA